MRVQWRRVSNVDSSALRSINTKEFRSVFLLIPRSFLLFPTISLSFFPLLFLFSLLPLSFVYLSLLPLLLLVPSYTSLPPSLYPVFILCLSLPLSFPTYPFLCLLSIFPLFLLQISSPLLTSLTLFLSLYPYFSVFLSFSNLSSTLTVWSSSSHPLSLTLFPYTLLHPSPLSLSFLFSFISQNPPCPP